jgi:hypothetical protein
MKKYFLFEHLLIIIFVMIIFSYSAIAHDIKLGGQLNTSLTGFYNHQLGFGYIPQANLDLELFLPPENNNEIKCAGYFYINIAEERVDFFWKKLYWKHRFDNFHLTIGRQPISWSFGSLLNPVDYSLGAVALDRDYNVKFQDALEIYYPINWHTSLSLLISSPGGNREDLKVGFRGRTLINDFDVTVNFVQEQLMANDSNQQRFGITAKGDIGQLGVYGALGYYRNEVNSFSLLAGADYSYFFQAGNQLYFQAEYLNIFPEILSQITGSMMAAQLEGKDKNIHLLVSNASYQIDEFSSIGLTSFYNLSDNAILFMPTYSNQINTNTTLEIQAGIRMESIKESDLKSLKSIAGTPAHIFVEIGINYAF